jgi:hypothetical protein
MQAFTPRRLTARPAESEQLSLQSTVPHYLVNSNKVCEKSLFLRNRLCYQAMKTRKVRASWKTFFIKAMQGKSIVSIQKDVTIKAMKN